ncbi:signal peptidase I [Pseudoxanthomonas sp. UTMC 1351]|uniref:signal peptidase I n=1 Tax=Pseudoxanthomonas sp. UTMC 1351 TaxID=2695853 RepID=UPI0034CF14D2
MPAHSSEGTQPSRRWGVEVRQLLLMLLMLTAARASFANHYQVPSSSMENTLFPGDRVAVNMMAYGVRFPFTETDLIAVDQPERGDIVVFDSPGDGTRLIKRVVAVAGDTVELAQGRLRVNGRALSNETQPDVEVFGERHSVLNLGRGGGPDIPASVVPAGKVLVLGDNRGNSADGRFFGWVSADQVYGKAVAVYYRRDQGFVWKEL